MASGVGGCRRPARGGPQDAIARSHADDDSYLAQVPEGRRAVLSEMREVCRRVLPGFAESMSYGSAAGTRDGRRGTRLWLLSRLHHRQPRAARLWGRRAVSASSTPGTSVNGHQRPARAMGAGGEYRHERRLPAAELYRTGA